MRLLDQRPAWNTHLADLTDADGTVLDQAGHVGCPGHAAYLTGGWDYLNPDTGQPIDEDALAAWENTRDEQDSDDPDADSTPPVYDGPEPIWGAHTYPVYVCTDPAAHGHRSRYGDRTPTGSTPAAEQTDEQREAARRDVIESNKAWTAATTVRRDWLRSFAARKTAPKGAAPFVAAAIARDSHLFDRIGGNSLAADLLGRKPENYGRSYELTELAEQAAEGRAWQLTLLQVLASYEDATSRDDWRHPTRQTTRYLRFLEAQGYTPADVELRACGDSPAAGDGTTQPG